MSSETHLHRETNVYTHAHVLYKHARTHAHVYTQTNAHMYAHTHTHICACIPVGDCSFWEQKLVLYPAHLETSALLLYPIKHTKVVRVKMHIKGRLFSFCPSLSPGEVGRERMF